MGFQSGRTSLTTVQTTDLADNAVTLAKMAAGTDGNIITYDASGDPAVAVTGTSGQVLTSNGAGAAPTMQDAGGGGMTLITRNALSASSSSSFTTSIDSTYDTYIFYGHTDAAASSSGYKIELSTDGGSTYESSGYEYTFHAVDYYTSHSIRSTGASHVPTTSFYLYESGVNAGVFMNGNFCFEMSYPSSTSLDTTMSGRAGGSFSASGGSAMDWGGKMDNHDAHDAIKFTSIVGTWTGYITMFGLNKS